MKRIALVTLHTPTPTNVRGASALPYHLLAFKSHEVDVEVWTFNLNGCNAHQIEDTEQELCVKIHIIEKPKWFKWLKHAPVRLFLPKPVLCYLPLPSSSLNNIKEFLNYNNAAVWIYGEDIAHLALNFKGLKTVVTTPDCEAMYYHRVLEMKGVPLSKLSLARYVLMYHRYAMMAAKSPNGQNVVYHLVGKKDVQFLKKLNPTANAVFIKHPHYELSEAETPIIKSSERIRLLIAGRYDFTMSEAADEAIVSLSALPQSIKDRFLITFLGKGWNCCADILSTAGFIVVQKGYVEDYAAEVSSHHIQLTPVAVGTGTKGKVLDAFINGLMVIGTSLALENIAVTSGKECVEYGNGVELAKWLTRVAIEPDIINRIASAGKNAVLREHGREKIAKEFFSLFE